MDIEEGAIAEVFKKLAHEDRELLLPLVASMRAMKLPGLEFIENHLQTVEGILDMPADDCVRTLAGEGKSYREARLRATRLAAALTDQTVDLIERARRTMNSLWPVLADHDPSAEIREHAKMLTELLESEAFFESLETLKQATAALVKNYHALYESIHTRRAELFAAALDFVKGIPEWAAIAQDPRLSKAEKASVLFLLTQRAGKDLDLHAGALACSCCKATIAQMETDISLVNAIRDDVIKKILELSADPDEKIERVRISTLFSGKLENKDDVEEAIRKLKEYLLKIVSSGASVILE